MGVQPAESFGMGVDRGQSNVQKDEKLRAHLDQLGVDQPGGDPDRTECGDEWAGQFHGFVPAHHMSQGVKVRSEKTGSFMLFPGQSFHHANPAQDLLGGDHLGSRFRFLAVRSLADPAPQHDHGKNTGGEEKQARQRVAPVLEQEKSGDADDRRRVFDDDHRKTESHRSRPTGSG